MKGQEPRCGVAATTATGAPANVYAAAIVACAAILSVIAWAAAFHPACSTPATATTASTPTETPVACSGAAKFTSDTQGSLPPVAVRPMTLDNSRTVSP